MCNSTNYTITKIIGVIDIGTLYWDWTKYTIKIGYSSVILPYRTQLQHHARIHTPQVLHLHAVDHALRQLEAPLNKRESEDKEKAVLNSWLNQLMFSPLNKRESEDKEKAVLNSWLNQLRFSHNAIDSILNLPSQSELANRARWVYVHACTHALYMCAHVCVSVCVSVYTCLCACHVCECLSILVYFSVHCLLSLLPRLCSYSRVHHSYMHTTTHTHIPTPLTHIHLAVHTIWMVQLASKSITQVERKKYGVMNERKATKVHSVSNVVAFLSKPVRTYWSLTP